MRLGRVGIELEGAVRFGERLCACLLLRGQTEESERHQTARKSGVRSGMALIERHCAPKRLDRLCKEARGFQFVPECPQLLGRTFVSLACRQRRGTALMLLRQCIFKHVRGRDLCFARTPLCFLKRNPMIAQVQ